MHKKFLICLLLLFSGVSYAQTTTVSAIVTDSDSTVWAGGSWKLTFKPNNNYPNINSYTINGAHLVVGTANQSGVMNNLGSMSFTTYDNSLVQPSGSSYVLTVCPNASAPCSNFPLSTAGSSMNISSSLTATISPPRFNTGPNSYGYADLEVTPSSAPGGTYWNVTLSTMKYWTGSSWATVGGSGTIANGTQGQIAIYPANGNSLSGADPATIVPTQIINVTQKGIVNDGVTSNTTALQNLLSTVGTGAIYFPGGKYLLTNTGLGGVGLQFPTNFHGSIYMDRGAQFVCSDGSATSGQCLFFNGNSGIHIYGLDITYSNAGSLPLARNACSPNNAILVQNSSDISFLFPIVESSPGVGYWNTGSHYISYVNPVSKNTSADGLHFENSDNFYVTGATIINSGDDAIATTQLSGGSNNGGNINGANIFNSHARGLAFVGESTITASNINVTNTAYSCIAIPTQSGYNVSSHISITGFHCQGIGSVTPGAGTSGVIHGIEANGALIAKFSDGDIAGSNVMQDGIFAYGGCNDISLTNVTISGVGQKAVETSGCTQFRGSNIFATASVSDDFHIDNCTHCKITNSSSNQAGAYGFYASRFNDLTVTGFITYDATAPNNNLADEFESGSGPLWFEGKIIDDRTTPTGTKAGGYNNGTAYVKANIEAYIPYGAFSVLSGGTNEHWNEANYYNLNSKMTNGSINPMAYGATGSDQGTNVTCTSGSATYSLAAPVDFALFNYVMIPWCGAAPGVSAPSASVVNVGTTGSTTYQYCVSTLDKFGGQSACGSTIQTTTGPATLGGANAYNEIVNYNRILITPTNNNAGGYAVYQKPSGNLLGITHIPGQCVAWKANYTYVQNTCVVPNASPNGWFYLITTAGVSGGTEPTWPTTVGASVTDNSAVWSAQAFTFADDELTTWNVTGGSNLQPYTVSPTAPSTAINDILTSTIINGAGTNTITLANTAGASKATTIRHDDTIPIQAALNDSKSAVTQALVDIYTGTGPDVKFPKEIYNISSALDISNTQYMHILGKNSLIRQVNSFASVFNNANSYRTIIDNMQVQGGWNQFYYSNANTDQARVDLNEDNWFGALNYSIYTLGTSSGDYHLSTQLNINSNHFNNNAKILFNTTDFLNFNYGWVEELPVALNNTYAAASGFITNYAGTFQGQGTVFIPQKTGANTLPYGTHWADNFGLGFVTDKVRWGKEQGGFPILWNYTNWYLPIAGGFNSRISITNSPELGAGAGSGRSSSIIRFVSGIPNQVVLTGNNTDIYSAYFSVDPTFNIPLDISPCISAGQGCFINFNVSPNTLDQGGTYTTYLIPDLLGFYTPTNIVQSTAAPTASYWIKGQTIFNSNPAASGTANYWVTTNSGMAEPIVARSTAYANNAFVEDPSGTWIYKVATAGTTAASAPSYTGSGTTTDGTAVFTFIGNAATFAAQYPGQIDVAASVAVVGTNLGTGGTCTCDVADGFSCSSTRGVLRITTGSTAATTNSDFCNVSWPTDLGHKAIINFTNMDSGGNTLTIGNVTQDPAASSNTNAVMKYTTSLAALTTTYKVTYSIK